MGHPELGGTADGGRSGYGSFHPPWKAAPNKFVIPNLAPKLICHPDRSVPEFLLR
jgi:hypothetical protein